MMRRAIPLLAPAAALHRQAWRRQSTYARAVGTTRPVRARSLSLGAAAAGALAYSTTTSDDAAAECLPGHKVRVVSYNVLSSHLCEPGYFVKCSPENLDPDTRLERVCAALAAETDAGAVICLQEVSRDWSGKLHAFFAARGYQFSTGLYGNHFNGYMGVAVAWPAAAYDVVGVDCARLADDVPQEREKRAPEGWWRRLAGRLGRAATALTEPLPRPRPPFDTWKEATRKHNVLVTATLRDKRAGGEISVATYHMPCLFGSVEKERVMTIHALLAARRARAVAAGRPYVLCGDFNIKPYDAAYALLTTGALEGAFADRDPGPQPRAPAGGAFEATLEPPLVSAYAAAGGEPAFTNFAYTKPMGAERDAFVETLDYIFCSPGDWAVAGVRPTPALEGLDRGKPLPTAAEPSDHVMISADLVTK